MAWHGSARQGDLKHGSADALFGDSPNSAFVFSLVVWGLVSAEGAR